MSTIEYVKLSDIDPDDFLPLLNNPKIREHLIKHELFDSDSVNAWAKAKIQVDSINGCRVRAIILNKKLVGWCGIQLEDEKYEIAIVIDDIYWGLGKKVFYELIRWAKTLGHNEIYIHLLHTRPEYKFLRKISTQVYENKLLGNKFTTYQLEVK